MTGKHNNGGHGDGERNKAVFRVVVEEGFSKGNLAALDDYFPPHFIEHQFDLSPTLEGMKGSIRYLRTMFPDFQLTVEDIVADGDKVWARLTGRGTNTTEFLGARPPVAPSPSLCSTCAASRTARLSNIGACRIVSTNWCSSA